MKLHEVLHESRNMFAPIRNTNMILSKSEEEDVVDTKETIAPVIERNVLTYDKLFNPRRV